MRAAYARIAILFVFLAGCSSSVPRPGNLPRASRPQLVLFLVIDGMRADYFGRFRDILGPEGLVRLYEAGTVFENARVEFFFSATAPGHATIATGCYPAHHGIVANEWWDREAGEKVRSCQDTSTSLLGVGGEAIPGASPRNLGGPHISSLFRKVYGRDATIYSVAGKDRSAVFLGGSDADGVFWFSQETGGFTTSTSYAQNLPAWIEDFNRRERLGDRPALRWELLLPGDARGKCADDASPYEESFLSLGTVFPHPITLEAGQDSTLLYEAFASTPLLDELTGRFVECLVGEEGIGTDHVPDLLLVSLSGLDGVGHTFGPASLEVGDAIWRVDRTVAELLRFLEDGMDLAQDCLIVLTSDHGMAPIPELVAAEGKEAGRLLIDPLEEGSGVRDVRTTVDEALDRAWGDAEWVLSTTAPCVFLNREAVDSSGHPQDSAERIAREALLGLSGVEDVFIPSLAPVTEVPGGRLGASLAKWYLPSRCGELVIHLAPHYVLTSSRYYGKGGTNHGSVHEYDTRIPLVFFGPGVRTRVRSENAGQADIVPTVLRLLGVQPGAPLDGKPLL